MIGLLAMIVSEEVNLEYDLLHPYLHANDNSSLIPSRISDVQPRRQNSTAQSMLRRSAVLGSPVSVPEVKIGLGTFQATMVSSWVSKVLMRSNILSFSKMNFRHHKLETLVKSSLPSHMSLTLQSRACRRHRTNLRRFASLGKS